MLRRELDIIVNNHTNFLNKMLPDIMVFVENQGHYPHIIVDDDSTKYLACFHLKLKQATLKLHFEPGGIFIDGAASLFGKDVFGALIVSVAAAAVKHGAYMVDSFIEPERHKRVWVSTDRKSTQNAKTRVTTGRPFLINHPIKAEMDDVVRSVVLSELLTLSSSEVLNVYKKVFTSTSTTMDVMKMSEVIVGEVERNKAKLSYIADLLQIRDQIPLSISDIEEESLHYLNARIT